MRIFRKILNNEKITLHLTLYCLNFFETLNKDIRCTLWAIARFILTTKGIYFKRKNMHRENIFLKLKCTIISGQWLFSSSWIQDRLDSFWWVKLVRSLCLNNHIYWVCVWWPLFVKGSIIDFFAYHVIFLMKSFNEEIWE